MNLVIREEKGSLVVEAIIGFMFFVILILNLIYLFKIVAENDTVSDLTKRYFMNAYLMNDCFDTDISNINYYKSYLKLNCVDTNVKYYEFKELENSYLIEIRSETKIYNIFKVGNINKFVLNKHQMNFRNVETLKSSINVWELSNLARGIRIAEILGKNNNSKWDIDVIQDNKAISVISIDLFKKTYNNISAIKNKINVEVKKIEAYRKKHSNFINFLYIITPINLSEEWKKEIYKCLKFKNIAVKFYILKGGN
ncbi:MAG: hypothetical protein N4A47_05445 [Clostridia bacterium]|jgi:hypothetical protein|nr:hypothetical protein [Clostridia bacterium]